MSRRSRRPARRHRRGVLLAVLLTPVLLAGACSVSLRPSDAPASRSASPSPGKTSLDLSRLPVPRTYFCDVLPEKDVARALGGPVARTAHYRNGEEFEVRPGYVDVSHEYGCVFQGSDGATARAWVFARPVVLSEARTLVRRARHQRDCAFPDSVRFGRPGLASVCEVPGDKPSAPAVRARLEGLFGDSWLACEVSEPLDRKARAERADVVQRAESWCVDVVTTIGARS